MKHGISPTTDIRLRKGRVCRYLKVMQRTGKNRDPAYHAAYRRLKGPLTRATGPGSYAEQTPNQSMHRRHMR